MSSRRNAAGQFGKPLPTDRVLAHEHVAITRVSCAAEAPFTAVDLEGLTGVPARRCGLVMAFLLAYGLVEKAPGRNVYRSTKAAGNVARAWEESEAEGLRALREMWKASWFARAASKRLAPGPTLRIGLVSKLMTFSHSGEAQRRKVEILVDLMVAVGMLHPEDDGYLRWIDDAAVPKPRSQPQTAPADAPPSGGAETPDEDTGPAGPAPDGGIPRPRGHADMPPASSVNEDLIRLISPPILLADLARLSSEDIVALHGHIRGLATLLAKLRGPSMP
ncbi:hypothetical protein KN815_08015 [Streptomyces sp. 4503]|uniref:Uncharacterized protein n=1 Tax=Streptomyces niphimycinicus TaxID=2842201 RepID=A0ABS6CAT9_9ACTN|nr:hypothetical protein [Streptomyces niphimycinicus]MBU3864026.1 hypothetical protein [Streptomyces niphimycinicus]